jgi:DNA-binding MurR/RpiR family transcriptional regulator
MFREKITRNYQSLSPSFKKIADFILTSHQRAAFMSASRLAKHLGVDVATVTRFAQHIGYDGYIPLLREIQETVLKEMREARTHVSDRLEEAEGIFAQTLWRDWANLEKTIQNVPLDQAEDAVSALVSARRVYVISEGVGAGLAVAAGSYLQMIKPEVVILSHGAFDLALALKDISAGDAVIGIGFTNYAYAATRALELGRKAGAITIGLIAQADCPIGNVADLLFSCSATGEGYLPSLTSLGAVLFALVYSVLLRDEETYNHKLLVFQQTYADLTDGTTRGEDDVVEDLIGLF